MNDSGGHHLRVEHRRLADRRSWLRWGPYLAERAWATVREDYSEDGKGVWTEFPHDHARSRSYRWNEDGLAGICDIDQELCVAFSFWNGRDPILKERLYGLTGLEGNHGEDVKEYWWYLDATPTHSYMKWAYAYPQDEFPYEQLIRENAARTREEPEFELGDTGVFDEDRYWDIEVTWVKESPNDMYAVVRATNRGPNTETLHILPTMWFRNQWSYEPGRNPPDIMLVDGALVAKGVFGSSMTLSGSGTPQALFCNNETNTRRVFHDESGPPFAKDGINDHVVTNAPTVDPAQHGSKAALWYMLTANAHQEVEIRLRFGQHAEKIDEATANDVVAQRKVEADEYYAHVIPAHVSDEDRQIARQAFAGLLWTKQFYNFDVERWINGDPASPAPPAQRRNGRNAAWWHVHNSDVISMPDGWEYPWYAAWDLAFHCIALAHVDPTFAKEQLLLLCREDYMHPNGQLPAYEWAFDDVNPPVHAFAAMAVYDIDGRQDREFLTRMFHKLLINFTWWVNRKDTLGRNVFEGGFLGLDNISPINRSEGVPEGFRLEQSDGTAWMAAFALRMMEMALELSDHDPVYGDLAVKFFDHFAYIANAMHTSGLWDESMGFYCDLLHRDDEKIPLTIRSMVGLIPLIATSMLPTERVLTPSPFADHFLWFVSERRWTASHVLASRYSLQQPTILVGLADVGRFERVLAKLLDEAEFLAPHGIRSLSATHRTEPFTLDVDGLRATISYEPAESQTPLFGGNSNWRGPVWFPVNYVLIDALRTYANHLGDDYTVAYPTGSSHRLGLHGVADQISDRLTALFRRREDGTRMYADRHVDRWPDRVLFYEYFDGDTGAGLGASHQTGWTALVADLIVRQKSAHT